MKKRNRNIMLALEATSIVGKNEATAITITAVAMSAMYGVFLFFEIFAKTAGSILSLPSAYEALVAE